MADDFDLKIRLNNIFATLGCYTRICVKLSEYTTKIPLELTDIDVLGINIHPDFTFTKRLADCTSQKNIIKSPIQRVFWLKGVMEFLEASNGYLALKSSRPITEVQRIAAQKLGITILNDENLTNLENRIIEANAVQLHMNKPEAWRYFENNLTTLEKDLAPLLIFRKYHYWIYPKYQNLHAIISLVKKNSNKFAKLNTVKKSLLFDLLTLFTLSLLEMSAYAFRVNPENPQTELKAYFHGGYAEMKRRSEIVSNIEKMLDMQKQKELFKSTVRLDPPYLTDLVEVAYRLLNKPHDASQLLRYLQVSLFEEILYNRQNSDGMKYLGTFSPITQKFARDITRFFCSATGISEESFSINT